MRKSILLSLVVCCLLAFQTPGFGEDAPDPEQLVAEHVKAIGAPELLAKIKAVTFVGDAEVNFIQGMHGHMQGVAMVVSEGANIAVMLKFGDVNYPGEYFAFDGKDVTVGHIKPGLKSPIADFLFRYNKMMKQGIVGGVFSNAWPLLDVQNHPKARMKAGKDKVDKVELYSLEYQPEDWYGNMKIRMYFEPETFRHVRTEYKVRTDNDMTTGFNPDNPSGGLMSADEENPANDMLIGRVKGESYYTLVEKFEDFKKVGALTLPHRYVLHYTIDGTAQSGFIADWTLSARQIGFNAQNIDPKVFQAEK
ncbi:MAG: hypothetical protein LBT74_10235 [Acidobacteriota bacterium]|jgi:hypothetical protein|nr:hypothetical protein [Acidobacteriota bacterium]